MNSLLKKSVSLFLNNKYGKKKYQKLFLILYNISIKGFNLANYDIFTNGELNIIKSLKKYFSIAKPESAISIFDIGANHGYYSKHIIEQFKGSNYSIYAFEPLQSAYNKLVEEFNESNNPGLNAYNFGFANFEGEVEMFADHESSELASIYKRDFSNINIHIKPIGTVHVKRLQTFYEEKKIEYIDFVKIDVEGAEIEVLKGAKEILDNQQIGFIQFEFGAGNTESKTYLKDFYNILSKNYVVFRILKDGLLMIDNYNSDFEILRLGNYFTISKNIFEHNKSTLKQVFNF